MKTIFFSILFLNSFSQASTCYGTTSLGKLENGVQLPTQGDNFSSYSLMLSRLGRTYVHSSVSKILIEAFENLNTKIPEKNFVYAETGFQEGGLFEPHKTHQNGLSVDLMVPTLDLASGVSVPFKTDLSNRFGYDVEFNSQGFYGGYRIDFEALGALIVEIHNVAKGHDIKLWRVIFAPDLQHLLYATKFGDFIQNNISISKKRSWVRHDEHIHIDFDIPCEPYK